ncbi:MAG: hypothetical protein KF729_08940 [Sandaracinaceae bacterium]|nr:hypothetical protein [Sandaracinaceae bacterium]
MTAYSFRIGVLDMPLFDQALWLAPNPGRGRGQKEARARRERLRREHREVITITLDEDAAAALADYLELDSDGLALDLERYTHVGYRAKARGLGGGRLGDAGEMLTFLAHRGALGRGLHDRLLRVVECRNWASDRPAPMPDFLVAGGKVLEIKTRELLDFQNITSPLGMRTRVGACDSLVGARWEGLVQLGFDDGVTLTRETHALRTKPGVIVPFPASAGVLDVVLVRDARVLPLRTRTDLPVTHRDCQSDAHNCWACCAKGESLDAHLIEMHNAPDELRLEGFGDHESWMKRYGAWSRALWSRSDTHASEAQRPLFSLVREWAGTMGAERAGWIVEHWSEYLAMATWERGLHTEGVQFPDEPVYREPTAARATIDDLPQVISAALDAGSEGRWEVSGMQGREYVVLHDASGVRVRGLMTGWAGGDVMEPDAELAVNRLLHDCFGESPVDPERLPISLHPVRVGVGDKSELLAWRPSRASERGWPRSVFYTPDRPWITWLRMGDPRASLFAFRDGRLEFTIRRGRA